MELYRKIEIFTAAEVEKLIKHKPQADEYENFLIYSDAKYPRELLDKQRPNEHETVKRYRKETYEPVFCEVFDRLLNSLNRIQRSDGYMLKYPDESQWPAIKEEERLSVYLGTDFSAEKDLMSWTFNVAMKQQIIDANGVVVIWGERSDDPTEYTEVTPYIINSDRILYYCHEKSILYKAEHERRRWYSIDEESWKVWEQGNNGQIKLVEEYYHGLPEVPMFKLGGVVKSQYKEDITYQSRFKGMLPWLNVATMEFSDLRAEITLHQYSTLWMYEDEQCPECVGMGFLIKESQKVPCTNNKCVNGVVPRSPFDVIKVRPPKANLGEQMAPLPPAGYIQKQTDIAELQSKRIEGHRYRALAAVNMQFLEEAPAAQSGLAKAYDRDETNNTFYGVALDLARVMEMTAKYTALWRYYPLYSEEDCEAMVPLVIVPNTFDILGSDFLVSELKVANDSKVNDAILSSIEKELIRKRFPQDFKLQNQLTDAFDLDPMSGLTEDEKALRVSNKGATKQDYLISTYIQDFIRMAYEENPEFNRLSRREKQAVMTQYADQKLQNINVINKLYTQILGDEGQIEPTAEWPETKR